MYRAITFELCSSIVTIASLFCVLALAACGDGDEVIRQTTTDERFREAMAEFADEDYESARKLFEAIVLQDPASDVADDAQYYLAESYFLDGDYHLAAYAYNRLRSFPSSPFYKIAIFKTGESYFHSSEPHDRDQKETRAAIDHFRVFVQAYAGDSLANVAQQRILELRTKLALKDFATAELYVKLGDYPSAIVYYRKVLDEYSDTEYYSRAVQGMLEALCALERGNDARAFADSIALARPNESAARAFQSSSCK